MSDPSADTEQIFNQVEKKGYPLDLLRFELCKITDIDHLSPPERYEQQCKFLERQLEKLKSTEISKITFEERLTSYIQGMILMAYSQQTDSGVEVIEKSIQDLIIKLKMLQNGQFEEFEKINQKDRAVYEFGTGLVSTFSGLSKFFNSS